jgi:hypothetical protein
MQKILLSAILLISTYIPSYSQTTLQFPAICMSTTDFSKNIIEKNKLTPVIMSYNTEKDVLYMILGNSKRMIVVSISSLKDENTCMLVAFDDAEGIIDFDKFKPREKI